MPGVPFEMLNMMEQSVIPLLKQEFSSQIFLHRTLRLRKVSESAVALQVEALEDQLAAQIEIAYLPRMDGLWLELGLRTDPKQKAIAEKQLEDAVGLTVKAFADQLYAIGEKPITEMLADALMKKDLKIAVAESMTGGLVAAKNRQCFWIQSIF